MINGSVSTIAQNLTNVILVWHKNLNFKHATHIIIGQVVREQKQRITVWWGRKTVFLSYQLLTAIWPENVGLVLLWKYWFHSSILWSKLWLYCIIGLSSTIMNSMFWGHFKSLLNEQSMIFTPTLSSNENFIRAEWIIHFFTIIFLKLSAWNKFLTFSLEYFCVTFRENVNFGFKEYWNSKNWKIGRNSEKKTVDRNEKIVALVGNDKIQQILAWLTLKARPDSCKESISLREMSDPSREARSWNPRRSISCTAFRGRRHSSLKMDNFVKWWNKSRFENFVEESLYCNWSHG